MFIYDELVKALNDYVEAKREYDKAHDEYEGYSWDWAGQDVIQAMDAAEKRMKTAFDAAVDSSVKEVLAKAGLTIEIYKENKT